MLAGSAEELPLPDAAVDLVAVGQAFHWFDLDRALPELARVLRPGGRLALFYNSRDASVAWVRALAGLIGDHRRPRRRAPGAGPAGDRDGSSRRRSPSSGTSRSSTRTAWPSWSAPAATRSGCPPDERAALLERVRGRWPGPTRSWSAGSTSTCRTGRGAALHAARRYRDRRRSAGATGVALVDQPQPDQREVGLVVR